MKRKNIAWLVVSCLMVAALLLASCAPAAVEEKKVTPPVAKEVAPPVKEKEVVIPGKEVVPEGFVKWRGVKLDGTVVEKMIEKPRYGGIHVTSEAAPPTAFDQVIVKTGPVWVNDPTLEVLIYQDWTRGPVGTGEWTGTVGCYFLQQGFQSGRLIESWEYSEPDTFVWHIRRGVHFGLDPTSEASRLVGGRELTAADVLFNLRRDWREGYNNRVYAYLANMENVDESIYLSPTDKWAVVMKMQPGQLGVSYEQGGSYVQIYPPEVIAKYGNMKDWRNVVGTGPFFLRDYVAASSLTYVRNPNYSRYDPFFPENRLPYLDGFKAIILPDLSTRMAALRTGKIDNLTQIVAESAASLMKTNPELESTFFLLPPRIIFPRNDYKPFDDTRVRRALNMGLNKKAICDLYYKGEAELFTYPILPIVEFKDMYIPLEQQPESVRELYEYHPDKARQLLKEAGYPQGFQTEILTTASDVDMLSIVKEDWAKIGVDLKFDIKESAVYSTISNNKAYTQMIMSGTTAAACFKLARERMTPRGNHSMMNDPFIEQLYLDLGDAYFYWDRKVELKKTQYARFGEQAWFIPLPVPFGYNLWQPWLKAYYGVIQDGYGKSLSYASYVWIDQALKKAMGR